MHKHFAASERNRYNNGISLVELIIGILILSMGVVSLLNMFYSGFPYIVRARDYAIAVNLCERFLNVAKTLAVLSDNPPIGETDLGPEIAASKTLQECIDSSAGMSNVRAKQIVTRCSPSSRLMRISVIIEWSNRQNGEKAEKVSLSSFACVPDYK